MVSTRNAPKNQQSINSFVAKSKIQQSNFNLKRIINSVLTADIRNEVSSVNNIVNDNAESTFNLSILTFLTFFMRL